jgi:hypothetical protein
MRLAPELDAQRRASNKAAVVSAAPAQQPRAAGPLCLLCVGLGAVHHYYNMLQRRSCKHTA